MSKANEEEQILLDSVVGDYYEPYDKEQRDKLIEAFNIRISEETEENYPGWGVVWKHGGGIACPPMPEDDARSIIALSCYLDLCGVDVSLTDRLAYWFFRGPQLQKELRDNQGYKL